MANQHLPISNYEFINVNANHTISNIRIEYVSFKYCYYRQWNGANSGQNIFNGRMSIYLQLPIPTGNFRMVKCIGTLNEMFIEMNGEKSVYATFSNTRTLKADTKQQKSVRLKFKNSV